MVNNLRSSTEEWISYPTPTTAIYKSNKEAIIKIITKILNRLIRINLDCLLLDNELTFPVAYCPECKKDVIVDVTQMVKKDDTKQELNILCCCECDTVLNLFNKPKKFRWLNSAELKKELDVGYIKDSRGRII